MFGKVGWTWILFVVLAFFYFSLLHGSLGKAFIWVGVGIFLPTFIILIIISSAFYKKYEGIRKAGEMTIASEQVVQESQAMYEEMNQGYKQMTQEAAEMDKEYLQDLSESGATFLVPPTRTAPAVMEQRAKALENAAESLINAKRAHIMNEERYNAEGSSMLGRIFKPQADIVGSLPTRMGDDEYALAAQRSKALAEKTDGNAKVDIEIDLELTPEEAKEGVEKELDVPGGKRISLRVPPGIKDGNAIRLRGEGENKGDLYFRIKVKS